MVASVSFDKSIFLVVCLWCAGVAAAPPEGYYDTVDDSSSRALIDTLHEVIDDHQRFPYTDDTTDIWDIVNVADEDTLNPGNILDIYLNASYPKISGGTGAYNREHSWPKSYGFPRNVVSNYPYTDAHHLFASDAGYNSARNNYPYRNCDETCLEKITLETNGRGGGSGPFPSTSNWLRGTTGLEAWQTWSGRQGDVARAMFYMDVRYQGGSHGVTNHAEPDLILTDDYALIQASNTGANESVAYMGMLTDLLAWHEADPVDDLERRRNDIVYGFQGNRNPFIDHPDWAGCVFGTACGGGGPGGGGDPIVVLASGETTTGLGRLTGAYTATLSSDDVYQVITETESGGKPSRRTSRAEHLWTFNVAAAKSATLIAEVAFNQPRDDDAFIFDISIAGSPYQQAFVVESSTVDQLYTHDFDTGPGGALTLRLRDSDRTRGSRELDSIRVDALRITYLEDGPTDTVPPDAPNGLVAIAGDGVVSLQWSSNPEPDLAGYAVYRSTGLAAPYSRLTAATLNEPLYVDTTVTNGVTYFYRVEAEDTSSNASAPSATVTASPTAAPNSSLMVLDSITLEASGNKSLRVTAKALIVDALGQPVSGAIVTGSFSGDLTGDQQNNTDTDGIARLQGPSRIKAPATVNFCVENVEKIGLEVDLESLTCQTRSF